MVDRFRQLGKNADQRLGNPATENLDLRRVNRRPQGVHKIVPGRLDVGELARVYALCPMKNAVIPTNKTPSPFSQTNKQTNEPRHAAWLAPTRRGAPRETQSRPRPSRVPGPAPGAPGTRRRDRRPSLQTRKRAPPSPLILTIAVPYVRTHGHGQLLFRPANKHPESSTKWVRSPRR